MFKKDHEHLREDKVYGNRSEINKTRPVCRMWAKVGAGTLAKLLDGIPTRSDERLLVGFDKS